jgi:hypothetical protein
LEGGVVPLIDQTTYSDVSKERMYVRKLEVDEPKES